MSLLLLFQSTQAPPIIIVLPSGEDGGTVIYAGSTVAASYEDPTVADYPTQIIARYGGIQ